MIYFKNAAIAIVKKGLGIAVITANTKKRFSNVRFDIKYHFTFRCHQIYFYNNFANVIVIYVTISVIEKGPRSAVTTTDTKKRFSNVRFGIEHQYFVFVHNVIKSKIYV